MIFHFRLSNPAKAIDKEYVMSIKLNDLSEIKLREKLKMRRRSTYTSQPVGMRLGYIRTSSTHHVITENSVLR